MAIRDTLNLEEKVIFLHIGDYLADKNFSAIQELLKDFHVADIAYVLNLLEEEDIVPIISGFEGKLQAGILAELVDSKQEYVTDHLEKDVLARIVENLESDDAADLLGVLDEGEQQQVLDQVDSEDARDVRELLQHEADTAGGIMSKEVVSIVNDATVEEAIHEIRRAAVETKQIYNVYVVDKEEPILLGVVPLNELVISGPEVLLSEIMSDVRSVMASLDQEDVARMAQKYNLVEIPVVDEGGRLLGRITYDDIMDVIEEEAEEDIARLAGTQNEESYEDSWLEISKNRIAWLIIGLAGGIFAAYIISKFEHALNEVLLLAFFVPVIMAMGGIVGIQSSTITVRALATGEIGPGSLRKRIIRELVVGGINGSICSLLITLLIFLWQGDSALSMVVGAAMFFVMMMSTLSGTLIPLLLSRFKVDPGIATGPFVTTLNDVVGLLIYFGLATLFIVLH